MCLHIRTMLSLLYARPFAPYAACAVTDDTPPAHVVVQLAIDERLGLGEAFLDCQHCHFVPDVGLAGAGHDHDAEKDLFHGVGSGAPVPVPSTADRKSTRLN